MFKQTTDQPIKEFKNPETVIGPSMQVEGNFKGDGDVIVDGEVKGTLKTKKDLRVGKDAKIKANIEAVNALIAGTVEGNIKVKERLELTPTARIIGDISTHILQTESGAMVNGSITMGVEDAHKETSTKKDTKDSKDVEKTEKEK